MAIIVSGYKTEDVKTVIITDGSKKIALYTSLDAVVDVDAIIAKHDAILKANPDFVTQALAKMKKKVESLTASEITATKKEAAK